MIGKGKRIVNQMRKLLLLFLLLLAVVRPEQTAFGAPYEGYNYSFWREAKPAPVPYLPVRQVDGEQLDIGSFKSPEDFYITDDGNIYLLDTGNNRVVCLDKNWNVVRIIDSFKNGGKEDTFREPQGIFIDDTNHMFIADTGNGRIVELTLEGGFLREIGAPVADILRENFKYVPIKLVVDSAKRLYVLGKGVFDGVMEFDTGGNFTGFMGVNKVQYNPVDLFWKRISTKEQRSKMELFIPVEFNNIDIDKEGFIYVTTGESPSVEPVRRLNPSGIDVLRRDGYFPPMGDIQFVFTGTRMGASTMVSLVVDRNGIYSILDTKRGRLFTYDRDGKLMYQFGQLGEQVGNFKTPVEVGMQDDKVVVLDKGLNQLVVFEPTRYGKTIRDAVIYSDIGDEERSTAAWEEVMQLNNNLEIAYLGMGKAQLRQGDNDKAMFSFQLGMHREYFSRAFERYRKDFMWDHFGKIASIMIAGIILVIVATRMIKVKETEPGVIRSAWYTIFHPFNGFWDLKYDNKGKVWFTLLILLLLSSAYTLKSHYSGFIFNPNITEPVNTLDEIKFVVLPFFLWCIANWSLTTLMDGEGKFKEIVMATGYALIPILLVQIPLILMSNIFTVQEASFYNLTQSIAVFWFVGLLFVGMLTVHQYSVTKTIVTMMMTLVVVGIFVFLGLLFFSLAQQMLSFGTTLYKEIIFRIGEG